MKRRNLAIVTIVALSSMMASGQNNCGVNPPTGTCAAPAPPIQLWCAGNNSSSTCPGGTSWVGFDTSSPAAGSWSQQFEGIDATSILDSGQIPGAQPDPNGAVGPTNVDGAGQYLEFAGNYVQAFDRATGNGIFSAQRNSGAAPQPMRTLFAPGGQSYCANPALDAIASYDRIDGVFVLGDTFNPGGLGNYNYCIGVSAPSGSVTANNLQGTNSQSFWNVYAFNIAPAIPLNAQGHHYFPDYERFGTWSDGFYVSWDLEDVDSKYRVVGFEVCQLDKASMVAGLSSNPPHCYTYIPSYAVGPGGTGVSLIHSLLPADFEGGNPIPSNTAGEYFLAQVNPGNPGSNNQCSKFPCTSSQLAFWTWSGFTHGAGPTLITLRTPYTPGCYNTGSPSNTYCVPEPYGGFIDSLGDRLNHRLVYRYVKAGNPGEYLAVAHTVQVNNQSHRTGIRYYKIKAGTSPSVVFIGNIQDGTNKYYLSMPSVAMDHAGSLGITYTASGNTSKGSLSNYDPSPFFVTVGGGGAQGTPVAILSNSGSSGQDETDRFWGEYVSVASDPNDDATFWAVNQYMKGDQISNCSYNPRIGSGCTWASRIFTCKKGSGC